MREKVSIVVPCFNSEKTLEKCISALLNQNYDHDYEIVMVDDGSTDSTAEIIKKNKKIKYVFQKNAGPAKARNNGWKQSTGNIVVFTDSDCVPEDNWLINIVSSFALNKNIGAVGGAYRKTINSENLLANLIGEEIKFRYKNIGKYTDAHGSYNLAVRKNVLEKIGGYNEFYPVATAEDWDLCYRIQAAGYKIYFNRKARVGHYHPTKLVKYLKTQFRHGYYRMKLYKDNPTRASGDKYSGNAKYIVVFSGLSLCFLIFSIFYRPLALPFLISVFALVVLNLRLFFYLYKKCGFVFALEDFLLQLIRGYFWFLGMIKGICHVFIKRNEIDELPKSNNWDSFWSFNTTSGFTKISWSKIRIMHILDKYVKSDMSVLDAGCGSGFFSKYFLNKKCNVFSLDYSNEALEITKKMTNRKANYINGDLLDENLCKKYEGNFDLIFSDGLFEHFHKSDQMKIINNMKIMKSKNGLIITCVPNKYSFWEVIRPIFMPKIKESPFVLKELIDLNKDLSLKTIEYGGINVFPFKYSPEFFGSNFGMILYCVAE